MPRYRVAANVLNLRVNDEFESEDPYYEPWVRSGYVYEIDGPRGEPVVAAAPGSDAAGSSADEGDPVGTPGPVDSGEGAEEANSGDSRRKSRRSAGGADTGDGEGSPPVSDPGSE